MVLGLRSSVGSPLWEEGREALVGTVKSMLNFSMIGNTNPWSLVLKLGLTKNTLCGNVFMNIMSLGTF